MPNRVVILIFTHKERLESHEKISLAQCVQVLGKFPIRLVCPKGLSIKEYLEIAPILEPDFLPSNWFSSLDAYNRLKMSPQLYRHYMEFDYMLTYELDAFVFRNELLEWCAQGWDYIGAPWFEGFHQAKPDAAYLGVGNSGFSLRRIETMLRISTTWKFVASWREIWGNSCNSQSHPLRKMQRFAEGMFLDNFHYPFCPRVPEDQHWCLHVPKAFPAFRLAPVSDAVRFSFEVNPGRLFQECGENLPFGCHKWMHYDPAFWLPIIRTFGYDF